MGNPLLGLVFHWLGGLAAGSFYLPFKAVRRWSWETYWLVGGVFSWIVAPWAAAAILAPGFWGALHDAPPGAIRWAFFWGLMWGIGGLTFGLSIRYLGMSLGYAVALGFCAVFGTIMPPIFAGTFLQLLRTPAGVGTIVGIVVCVAGIAVAGLAGRRKERELGAGSAGDEAAEGGAGATSAPSALAEFSFAKGILVATFAGILSASMAYGLAAAEPIARAAVARGANTLWSGLPKLVVVLAGGFTTNAVWCVALNLKNRTWREYFGGGSAGAAEPQPGDAPELIRSINPIDAPSEQLADEAVVGGTRAIQTASPPRRRRAAVAAAVRPPLLANLLFCAAAGVTWYLQFFFYTMGETQMGRYKFSSWTLHMASIIIFSTIWGVALHEWRGTSRISRVLLTAGLALLVLSTIIVGYGNWLAATH